MSLLEILLSVATGLLSVILALEVRERNRMDSRISNLERKVDEIVDDRAERNESVTREIGEMKLEIYNNLSEIRVSLQSLNRKL